MSDPSFRALNLGDTADDDGQVIDSLVMAESTPPTPVVGPIVTPVLSEPKVPTRLLSGRQSVNPSWSSPTVLLPEDTRRKFLTLSVEESYQVPQMVSADPPIGVGPVSFTVPTGERWEVLSVRHSIATSAAVGNRTPEVSFFDPSNTTIAYLVISAPLIAPSSARNTGWWVGGSGSAGSGASSSGLPDSLILEAGSTITLSVFGMDAGDDISAVRITYRNVAATSGIVIRSDNGGSGGLAFIPAGKSVALDNHTGAVLVMATGSNSVYVNYWSVTE